MFLIYPYLYWLPKIKNLVPVENLENEKQFFNSLPFIIFLCSVNYDVSFTAVMSDKQK